MRALRFICVLTVVLTGCAVPVATTGQGTVTERRTGGKAGGVSNPTIGNPALTGGAGLVAAGAGNLTGARGAGIVAAGAGNLKPEAGTGLVAAGAGNLTDGRQQANNGASLPDTPAANSDVATPGKPSEVTTPAAPAPASPSPTPSVPVLAPPSLVAPVVSQLIGPDGATLIGADGGSLVAPGGGALAAGLVNHPGGESPTVVDGVTPEPVEVTLQGTVRAPGALADGTGLLRVSGARVALFTLMGEAVAEATTDAQGHYAVSGTVPGGLCVVRAGFKVGGRTVYLSAVCDTTDAAGASDLDPASTLFEARFFQGVATRTAGQVPALGADFLAWHAATAGLASEVALDALAPEASLASRAEAWAGLAAKHPDIAAFDALDAYLDSATL